MPESSGRSGWVHVKTLAFLLFFALPAGCAKKSGSSEDPADSNQAAQAPDPIQAIDVASASGEQCAAGGKVYSVYLDSNRNARKDLDETVLSSQVVCNGVNGQNGADGRNGTDGQNGADGRNGVDGQNGSSGVNGHGVVFKVLTAPAEICANGGTTILLATDILDSGTYSASLPNQQAATICNGTNAQTPAYAPVESIQPCGDNVPYKEVLLRLQNGQVLGSFSNDMNGSMTRLAFLPDGSYVDTDGSNCQFSLSTSVDGATRSISWNGQVRMSWPMSR